MNQSPDPSLVSLGSEGSKLLFSFTAATVPSQVLLKAAGSLGEQIIYPRCVSPPFRTPSPVKGFWQVTNLQEFEALTCYKKP